LKDPECGEWALRRRELGLALVRGRPSSRVGQQNSLSSSSESARKKTLSTSMQEGVLVELQWMKERKESSFSPAIPFFLQVSADSNG